MALIVVGNYDGASAPATIVVWGCNPVVSNPDGKLGFRVRDALRAGSYGIAVDPRNGDFYLGPMRELAQGLRKKMPGLKVVLVSGYAGDPERTSGLEASRFVQKPFSMHHLASTVREVLDADNQNN